LAEGFKAAAEAPMPTIGNTVSSEDLRGAIEVLRFGRGVIGHTLSADGSPLIFCEAFSVPLALGDGQDDERDEVGATAHRTESPRRDRRGRSLNVLPLTVQTRKLHPTFE